MFLAIMIKDKAEIRNLLFDMIQENDYLNSRANHLSMDVEDLVDFPRLTIDDLEKVTVGVYQIKIGKRKGIEHTLWVQYRPGGEGAGSITGWYCKCQSGARTLGYCAHVVSVLWYFGIGRHMQNLTFPAENIAAHLRDVRYEKLVISHTASMIRVFTNSFTFFSDTGDETKFHANSGFVPLYMIII
ncbi:unnamed protein product [Allacma fusca]|uniref:SWIM-type domain-containing protein n=1 Tax=Allacma fusca TaxID=39272 RepID=A0A8J2JXP2_9HEXA|nr:unnamed protein product [Allacma fusca]